jgi:hypothetical protein
MPQRIAASELIAMLFPPAEVSDRIHDAHHGQNSVKRERQPPRHVPLERLENHDQRYADKGRQEQLKLLLLHLWGHREILLE